MTERDQGQDRRLVLVLAFDRAAGLRTVEELRNAGAHVPQPATADGTPQWVTRRHRGLLAAGGLHPLDPQPHPTVTMNDARVAELRSWLEVHFVGAATVVVADPLLAWFEPGWAAAAAELGAHLDVVVVAPRLVTDVVVAVTGDDEGPVPPWRYAGAVALLLRAATTRRAVSARVVKAAARRRGKSADAATSAAIPADLAELGDRVLVALRDPASADLDDLVAGYDAVIAAAGSALAAPPVEAASTSKGSPAVPARATGARRLVHAARRRAVPERVRRRTRVWAADRAERMARAALRALHR